MRGFDLSCTDLRGTGIEHALRDDSTILDGAKLDHRAARMLGRTPTGRLQPSKPGTYTKVIIPDLSDAELLEREFVIRDPRSLERLTAAAPPTDQWITYEERYDVGDAVKCSFGHAHKKGYAFRDEAGRRYLVVRLCGAAHLGMGNGGSSPGNENSSRTGRPT